ncbi:hypothetical protein [Streptomyces sp. NPDC005907]|uniref:hypothetical protein n=1 Tax=Streptomyces sp. NPDC005907 TaxID=3154571 RepID=UPI0033C584AE
MSAGIARRTVLEHAAALAGGAALASIAGTTLLTPSAHAATTASDTSRNSERNRVLTARPSANGWEMEKVADGGGSVWTRPVAGTGLKVAVRIGDVQSVLVHVIRRFHYEVETLNAGDIVGYGKPSRVLAARHESNHASGTAVDLLPGSYPVGAKGGLFPTQVDVIRDILADCEGVVAWGGDLRPAHEGHFEIRVGPGDPRLAAVAAKVRRWNREPGQGAGVLIDASSLARRRRSAEYR